MWFSNRRAKWRREEKLRTHRRDIESVSGGLGMPGVPGGAGAGPGVGVGLGAAAAAGRMASSVVNGPPGQSRDRRFTVAGTGPTDLRDLQFDK